MMEAILETLFGLTFLAVIAFVLALIWAFLNGARGTVSDAVHGTLGARRTPDAHPTPEASKRRFASQAEAEHAVARSQADFARGGPRTSKYAVPLDHAYERDGDWYVSSKPKY